MPEAAAAAPAAPAAPAAAQPTTPAAPAAPAPAAPSGDAKPADGTEKPADAAPAPKVPMVTPQIAEFQRREFRWRNEKKQQDDKIKELETKVNERAANEAIWRDDPVALLEAFGHTQDGVIDFMAAGGSKSPEGRVRALESKLAREKREREEAETKKQRDADEAAARASYSQAVREAVEECGRLVKEERFDLCGRTPGIEREVVNLIIAKAKGDPDNGVAGEEISVEQALELCEAELDRRMDSYAQSGKLKAKLAPPPADGSKEDKTSGETPRQPQGPVGSSKRTVTIKNRQQAGSPIRVGGGRIPSRDEAVKQAGANLASLIAQAK